MTLNLAEVTGVGTNVSQTGAYFVTGDEIPVELTLEKKGRQKVVYGKIVRLEQISEGSQGVAIEFDTRLLDF